MTRFSIAFYNTENFFDIRDDADKIDTEFTPDGSLRWTRKRYGSKLTKIAGVISRIGFEHTGEPPLIAGLAEIENKSVLNDLTRSEQLSEFGYDYVHFNSPDERGIDNAILYRKERTELICSEPVRHIFKNNEGDTDYSRDVLHAKFRLDHHILDIFVTHFPSRADRNRKREFRNQIMSGLRSKIDGILDSNPLAQIVVIGDMNGNPDDPDAVRLLRTTGDMNFDDSRLYNPMLNFSKKTGSLTHRGRWMLFDQMLFSKSFLRAGEGGLNFESAHIYSDPPVAERSKKYPGKPFRTFAGAKYLGGYSDHFPVYAILNY